MKPRVCNLIASLGMVVGLCFSVLSYGEEAEGDAEYHPNLLAVFLGVTSEQRRESGFALGIEYERRFSELFGLGVLAEHTYGDVDITVYAVPFAYHLDRWKFYAAPGIEDGDHGTESLFRIGAEYAFEMGGLEISPQLDIDFVDGDSALVLGVTIGKGY